MAELPRTEDLPRSTDGFEPARVEEAFSRFGERVRELESVAADLRAELRALRAERSAAASADLGDEDWPGPDETAPPADWVAAIPPPFARGFGVPRLAVEILFLLAVALLAGLADLETPWIVVVMAGAWVLVVLSEWAAATTRARWHLEEIPPPLEAGGAAGDESTGPWSVPVVEATVVEGPDVSESHTVVASLPAPLESTDEAAAAGSEEPAPAAAPAAEAPAVDETPVEDAPVEGAPVEDAEPGEAEHEGLDPAAAGEVVAPPRLPEPAVEASAGTDAESAEPAGDARADVRRLGAEPEAEPEEGAGDEDAAEVEPVAALPAPLDETAANGAGAADEAPPAAGADDADAAPDRPRRRFWQRRREEAPAQDPWER